MILRNARLWGRIDGHIDFNENIRRIGKSTREGIDLKGAIVLPGLIDIHAHLRAPGAQSHKEDFITGGKAALHGGAVHVFDMPNKSPAIDSLERLKEARKAARASPVKIHHYLLATEDNVNIDYPLVKIVYGGTTGTDGISIETIGRHLEKRRLHVVHCEDSRYFTNDANHCLARPPIAEENGVKDVKLVAGGGRLHFTHLSTPRSIALAAPYTCDVTPHHLFLTEKDQIKRGPFAKMNPPLRSESDVASLRSVMRSVNCISTDHAPHTYTEKLDTAPSGVPELDTLLPLLMSGVEDGWLTIEDIISKCVTNPAKLMGLRAGIEVGNPADLVVLEKRPWRVTSETIESKCGWSPYEGRQFNWHVKATIVDGEVAWGSI